MNNRLLKLLLLPAWIAFFLVGWSLFWIGHQRESRARLPAVTGSPCLSRLQILEAKQSVVDEQKGGKKK